MSNLYQPVITEGNVSSWKRACKLEIINPAVGAPTVVINEEIATMLPNGSIVTNPSTSLSLNVSDMTPSFDLLDPSSGAVVGTMTYGQLYATIYAFYLHRATLRDEELELSGE